MMRNKNDCKGHVMVYLVTVFNHGQFPVATVIKSINCNWTHHNFTIVVNHVLMFDLRTSIAGVII